MKKCHIFRIVWEYSTVDCESHSTLVQESSTSVVCAIHRFLRYFKAHISPYSRPEIISVVDLGPLEVC